jgi:hypothetical protein
MKKKRVILFPGSEDTSVLKENNITKPLKEIRAGKIYKIGQPSNRYYQYIHPIIDPKTLNIQNLEDFKKIENIIVRVISILRMSNGSSIAVLKHYKDQKVIGNIEKIFADVDMSIKSKELVNLDSDTQSS